MSSVEGEARLRHFHHEDGARRVARAIVRPLPRHHGHVWLRLGFVVESYGHLDAHQPAVGQERPQRVAGSAKHARVITPLGLGNDEVAANQLHRFVVEHSEVHESVVFRSSPASERQRDLLHRVSTLRCQVLCFNAEGKVHGDPQERAPA